VTSELSAKRVALLREAIPKASRVGVLFNPANVSKPPDADRTRIAAEGLGLKVQTREVLERVDIDGAFSAFAREHAEAVIVLDDAFMFMHARRVAELAVRHRLPTMHVWPQSVVAGGLMSYGPNPDDMLRLAAIYVDRILKGAKPADLPVEQPTKFELVINLKTAKALGLTIPQTFMLRADQVIE
jgi:putative ABC transport system substrate-binding protein